MNHLVVKLPVDLIDVEENFRQAAARRLRSRDCNDPNREIIVSPWWGRYGLAGFVVAINGSPPRAVVLWDCEYGGKGTAIYLSSGVALRSMLSYDDDGLGFATSELLKAAGLIDPQSHYPRWPGEDE